jgi:hypothetical protein
MILQTTVRGLLLVGDEHIFRCIPCQLTYITKGHIPMSDPPVR